MNFSITLYIRILVLKKRQRLKGINSNPMINENKSHFQDLPSVSLKYKILKVHSPPACILGRDLQYISIWQYIDTLIKYRIVILCSINIKMPYSTHLMLLI